MPRTVRSPPQTPTPPRTSRASRLGSLTRPPRVSTCSQRLGRPARRSTGSRRIVGRRVIFSIRFSVDVPDVRRLSRARRSRRSAVLHRYGHGGERDGLTTRPRPQHGHRGRRARERGRGPTAAGRSPFGDRPWDVRPRCGARSAGERSPRSSLRPARPTWWAAPDPLPPRRLPDGGRAWMAGDRPEHGRARRPHRMRSVQAMNQFLNYEV